MKPTPKFSFTALALFAITGFAAGLFLQEWRSGSGLAPFTPPISLPASLAVLGALLTFLALRMKSAIAQESGEPVNPFHAVRLLAAARASQITGTLFIGFSAGLLTNILGRTVAAKPGVWIPMLVTLVAAVLLLIAGLYTEHVCKVPPPKDGDGEESEAAQTV